MNNIISNHIPVFYEGQDDLIDILATSMCSICYNTKSFIDFYILDCGIHEFNKKQLESLKEKFNNFSIKYIPIDLKQFSGLKGYITVTGTSNFVDCYSRLLIPELVPELDRAIYLDTDTITLKDIKLLWNEDLGDASIGVIPDLGFRESIKNNFIKNLSGSINQIYLSGGLFIIDCKKWREKNITNSLFKIAREKKDNLLIIIEDLLSLYFSSDYKLLNSRYGFIEHDNKTDDIPLKTITKEYLEKEWKDVAIVHFAGNNKVWKTVNNIHTHKTIGFFDSFWFFAKMTPFYEGMLNRYNYNINIEITNYFTNYLFSKCLGQYCEYWIKLFGFLPFLKIKNKNNKKVYKLFGFLPILKIKNK